jgi:hypothetical protein
MYIRKSLRSYKGRTYTNYLLVESVDTPKGPRQRTVCSLGDLSPRPRDEWLKLARRIEDALIGQSDLLDADVGEVADIVGRVRARRARHRDHVIDDRRAARSPGAGGGLIKVDPTRVTTERHREAGPVHVGHQFWRRLGLDDILRDCKLSAAVRKLACVMTLNRLIAPCSEHAMPDWVRRTALADILGVDFNALEEDPLYRVLDKLHPHRAVIEAALVARERSLFNLDATVYLYDLTSTYFEGQCARNGKAKRGYSRDHRPDCKQVVVGLVVSREGFPIAHEVFAGNIQDRATLATMLDLLTERAGLKEGSTVVVDRGMRSMRTSPRSSSASSTTSSPAGNPSAIAGLAASRTPKASLRCCANLLRSTAPRRRPQSRSKPARKGVTLTCVPRRATHRQGSRHSRQAGRPPARRHRQADAPGR